MSKAATELNARAEAYRKAKQKRDNALDSCGIGHDVQDRLRNSTKRIAEVGALFTTKAIGQLNHDALTNTCDGSVSTLDITGERQVRMALASTAAEVCRWGIEDCMEMAAKILEDANAHPEAAEIRRWAADGKAFAQITNLRKSQEA